jgi:hypothetical protein
MARFGRRNFSGAPDFQTRRVIWFLVELTPSRRFCKHTLTRRLGWVVRWGGDDSIMYLTECTGIMFMLVMRRTRRMAGVLL